MKRSSTPINLSNIGLDILLRILSADRHVSESVGPFLMSDGFRFWRSWVERDNRPAHHMWAHSIFRERIGLGFGFLAECIVRKKIGQAGIYYVDFSWFWNFSYFFRNRSIRPAVSTNFCLPVKNGWHLEQISTLILDLVEPTSISLPHAQRMVVLAYSGWMSFFMIPSTPSM